LFLFYIRFGSPLLKERNFFRKKKIKLGTRISLLPRHEKKKCLNPDCKGQLGGHQIVIHSPSWTIWWPLDFFFLSLKALVATRSFHVKQQRTIWWSLDFCFFPFWKPSGDQIVRHYIARDNLVATRFLSKKNNKKMEI
jgi:hypothetical protein